jgi:TP901 family phage tail tape measure protein
MGVDAGSIFSEVRISLDKLKQDISSVEAEFDKFGTKNKEQSTKVEQDWSKGFNAASIAGVAAFVAIGVAVKSAISVFAQFDDSMAQVHAVMSGSETDFANLESAALKMGASTHFTAREASDALYILSKSGREASESIELLHKAELLAGASGGSLAEATKMIVQVMNQFGLGAESANRIVEVIAASKIPLSEFSNTLAVIGPVAAGMGIPLENLVAVLKILTKTGLDAGSATMALKMILGDLGDSTSPMVSKLAQLGVAYDKLNPATNTFAEIIGNLSKAGITAQEAMATFGNRAGPVMVTLLAQGQKGIEDYTKSITGTDTAAEMYEKRNSTLADSMKEVGNAFDVSSGKIIKEFEPAMKSILEVAKQLINWIGNLPGPLKIFIGIVALGIPVVIGIASAIQLLGTVLTASAGIISLVIVGIAALAMALSALPHLLDPLTRAQDAQKALQEATDNLVASNKELQEINEKLKDSTSNLSDAERELLKIRQGNVKAIDDANIYKMVEAMNQEIQKTKDLAAYQVKQIALQKQLNEIHEGTRKQIQVTDKAWTDVFGLWGSGVKNADEFKVAMNALADSMQNTDAQLKGSNETYNSSFDALVKMAMADNSYIEVIRKQNPILASQIWLRTMEIQKEKELAEIKKKGEDEEKARTAERLTREAKYRDDLKYVNDLIEAQKTNLDKLRETLAKLNAIRELTGNDEKARQKAIAEVTAKITEEEAKLAAARAKSNAMLDEYKQKFADLHATEIEQIENARGATIEAIDKTKAGWLELVEAVNKYYDAVIDKKKKDDVEKAIKGTIDTAIGLAQTGISAISDLMSAIGEARIADLDRQLQAELEAAGVAEDTTVEKAQKELDVANKTGDAKVIKEKQDALAKAQIEQDYAHKKAQIEYETAKTAWSMQLVMAGVQAVQAALAAYSSASAIPLVGWVLGPIAAGVAAVFGAIQVAAIASNPPQPPAFEYGGIVTGNSFSGDRVPAMVNSGEMILTREQQARLMALANGQGGSSGVATRITIPLSLDGKVVAEVSANYYNNGQVRLEQ